MTSGIVNGNAIVRGHAVVAGGTVTDNADIADYAVVVGGTVRDFARLRDNAFVNIGTVRGDALVAGYGTVGTGVFDQGNATSGALVSGTTVVKGFGYVAGAPQMNGNAMVMASGIGSTDRVTTIGVQYNGEPSDLAGTNDELGLEDIDFQNLFARYLFTTQDDNAVWDNVNTTYGWMSATPATWLSASGVGGLSGVLEFTNENQFVELSSELVDLRNETIQFWTRWDGTGSTNQKIFEFARDADNYMYLQPTSVEGGVKFVIAVNGVVRTLRGADPLVTGQWQHVAVSFNNDTAKLYVNASAVSTWNNVTMDPYQVRATSALLGRGFAAGSGYHGRIDNLLVYSDARTPTEILTDVRAILGAGYVPAPDAPPDQNPPSNLLAGDYNVDGAVDSADYVVWRKFNGQTVPPGTSGDGTGNGVVDAEDYDRWTGNFGQTQAPPAAASAVDVAVAALPPSSADTAINTVKTEAFLGESSANATKLARDEWFDRTSDMHSIGWPKQPSAESLPNSGLSAASEQRISDEALQSSLVAAHSEVGNHFDDLQKADELPADSNSRSFDRYADLAPFWEQIGTVIELGTKQNTFSRSLQPRGYHR